MKPMTIRLPDDVQEYLNSVNGLTGVPKVRIIADAIRTVRDQNQKQNYERKPTGSRKASRPRA